APTRTDRRMLQFTPARKLPASADNEIRRPGMRPRSHRLDRMMPYLEALRAYARRQPGRFHVPGHKGGAAAPPEMMVAFGERALAMDIPALTQGIDTGPEPTPFQQAQLLAAEAWGARRTWFLINGASQGNHAACLTLAQSGNRVV